jgi:hypothetical protein
LKKHATAPFQTLRASGCRAPEPERHPAGCITVDQLVRSDALGNDFAGEVGEPMSVGVKLIKRKSSLVTHTAGINRESMHSPSGGLIDGPQPAKTAVT